MSASEQERELLDIVRSHAAAVLGYDFRGRGWCRSGVQGFGLRFVGRCRFRNRLKSISGLKLPTSIVFDHPTPTALARYLTGVLDSDGAAVCGESEAVDSGDVVYASSCDSSTW